jgi:2-polyprenyl-3-methyl-5-hydroxy-6-metoxy-1,4-benzoquinol methylase
VLTRRQETWQSKKARARSLLVFCRPVIPALSRHLDIGCSMGNLLEKFQESYHNKAVGVEPGEAHRTRAKEAGLTVYASLEELQQVGEAQFDLVSLAHVVEHLPDPAGYLTYGRIYIDAGWLASGGSSQL